MRLLSNYYENFHAERNKRGTVNSNERIKFIKTKIGKEKKVLDLGCRYGDLSKYYLEKNKVIGCDIDRNALSVCKERYKIITKLQDLNQELKFDNDSFDVVVLSEVLEHLPYPNITLSEITRVLKNNGILVGSVPNGTRLKNRTRFLLKGVVEKDRTHLFHYSRKSLEKLLKKYFRHTEYRNISGKLVFLSSNLFANYILFSAASPIKYIN